MKGRKCEVIKEKEDYSELISIIVPAYGVEAYIGKCLESLIAQTYAKLEIIVIDDGSKDQSGAIAEQYAQKDNRIRVYHKENGGLSDARNYGIERANGKYITCVDSDDYVDRDYVQYLYYVLKKYSARISFCQHRVHFPNGHITDYGKLGDESIRPNLCIERIMYDDVLNTSAWAKLYDKDLFQYTKYPVGMLFEDIGTTYKLLMLCEKIAIGYESKYNYILRKNSIVRNSFNKKKLDLITLTDVMAADVEKVYPELSNAVLRRRVYARFSTLNQMLDTHECEAEKQEMIAFIRENRSAVIKNIKAPKRDKIAIILLACGFGVYRRVWLKRQEMFFD